VLNLVEILYNNTKVDEALALVSNEIQKYPNQPELQMAAHSLLKEKGRNQESVDYLYQAFSSSDLDPEVKSRAYSSFLNEIKTQERESLLDSLESLMKENSPQNASIYAAMGERRVKSNDQEAAIEYFKRSLQLNPKDDSLLEQVILSSFDEGANFQEVEKFTIMGVEEFPQKAEFWFYDGVVKSAQKKDSVAVVSLEKALKLNARRNPQLDQVAYGSLGNSLYNLGQKEQAFDQFELALKINPNDEQVLNNYAYFLSVEKLELEKAKEMSEKVVIKFPNNGTFLDTYAWILFQLQDYELAKKYMDMALAQETEPSGVMLEHYGDILYHLGEKAEAISYWKKAQATTEVSKNLALKIKEGKYHE
jgi:tetratricopeptide (TPR) repeat protein